MIWIPCSNELIKKPCPISCSSICCWANRPRPGVNDPSNTVFAKPDSKNAKHWRPLTGSSIRRSIGCKWKNSPAATSYARKRISSSSAKPAIEVTPEDIVLKRDIQHEHKEKTGTIHICEFQSGRMFRSIHLSKRINPDKVKAEIKDGLLKLKVEIVEEARAKKIKPEAA